MTNNRKRKSVANRALDETGQDENDENVSTQTRAPAPTQRRRKAPRPSFEVVEIDSEDEEPETHKERLTGAARGLNPRDVIPPTQPSVELEDGADGEETKPLVRHATRQSRYGKSEANYDMKYHPMDIVTQPKRAAKRRSTSGFPDVDVDVDAETEEDSVPSSTRGSDESDESSDEEIEIVPRMPDPKATRHSGRNATQKAIDYSSKHHPQDFALPGHRNKARARKKLLEGAQRGVSVTPKPGKASRSTVDLTNEATDEENMSETDKDGPIPAETAHSPRNELRTLTNSRKRAPDKKPKTKKAATETGVDVVHLFGTVTDPAKQALTSSEASLYRKLNQKVEEYKATQRNAEHDLQKLDDLLSSKDHNDREHGDEDASTSIAADNDHSSDNENKEAGAVNDEHITTKTSEEEINEDQVANLPKFQDLRSSNSTTRQHDDSDGYEYGDGGGDMFMFGDGGPSSDGEREEPGSVNDEQKGSRTNDTETRRDSHQSQDLPPPSQFDEQFATTETRDETADKDTPGDVMSGLEPSLHNPNVPGGWPSTDGPDLIPEEDVGSSNVDDDSSKMNTEHHTTPDTSHVGSNQASRQHSASNKPRPTLFELQVAHKTGANGDSIPSLEASLRDETLRNGDRFSRGKRPNLIPEKGVGSSMTLANDPPPPRSRFVDVPLPAVDDDNLLRSFRSSQRTVADTDSTTVGTSNEQSDDRADLE